MLKRLLVVLLAGLAVAMLAKPGLCDYAKASFDNLRLDTRLTDDFGDGAINPAVWSQVVARIGYNLWLYPDLPPPFVQASEPGGQLVLSGNGYQTYDYGRYLVSVQTFTGPCTLEVDLTGVCGDGSQWGAGLGLVKDDYALQAFEDLRHWGAQPDAWPISNYQARWLYGHSCRANVPGCTPQLIANTDVGSQVPVTETATMRIMYDGDIAYTFQWVIAGHLYQGTYSAPEALGNYRVYFGLGVRLPGVEDSCATGGAGPGGVAVPGLGLWGLIVACVAVLASGLVILRRKRSV